MNNIKEYIYGTKEISYKSFIKIRLSLFDNKHNHINKITTEGLRMIFFLITRSTQGIYLTTTLRSIQEQLNISKYKTQQTIDNLLSLKLIYIYDIEGNILKDNKDINRPIIIETTYNNNYNLDEENGYKIIPFDYCYKAVKELNDKEFTMLLFLITRHRYYGIYSYTNENYEMINKIIDYSYAFPTQEDISRKLKCKRGDIKNISDNLVKKKYITYSCNEDKVNLYNNNLNKCTIKNKNITYKVKLLNNKDYIRHYIYDYAEEELKKYNEELKKEFKEKTNKELLLKYEHDNTISYTMKNKLYLETQQ